MTLHRSKRGGLNYASVCSGIGAPEQAWKDLGWLCRFHAEIEKFPATVYAKHFPDSYNLGDITKFHEWPEFAIDLLVGGTPCQSFSVAGLRKGLADPRGNLALTFLAIVERYRPRWLVWENVPGVLSADKGRAFGAFLGGLVQLGYGFAYRVLDARYFNLAQRRERVFVVGHSGGQWQRAAAVLFERESLCGNPPPSRETGKGVAPSLAARTRGGGGLGTDSECDGAVIPFDTTQVTSPGNYSRPRNGDPCHPLASGQHPPSIAHSLRADGFDASEDGTGRGTPLVARSLNAHAGPHGRIDAESETFIAFSSKDHGADAGELSPTLRACSHDKSRANSGAPPAIAFKPAYYSRSNKTSGSAQSEVCHSLTHSPKAGDTAATIQQDYAVRRLTPEECEKLQGFPVGFTRIEWRGKPAEQCPDGPRYKALGNSMAVPVIRWIGERIEMVDRLP